MRTTVVQAHPRQDCYNAALLDAVVTGLRGAGRDPQVVRLCGGDTVGDLASTEHLVAVYPTWWGATPAVMLDWLQRSFGPWIDGARPDEPSPLGSVSRLSVVSTHGSSRWVNIVQGEPGLCLWKRSVLPLCASDATFDWVALYGIDRLGEQRRSVFIDRVKAVFAAL